MNQDQPEISIVVPVYNEEPNLPQLFEEMLTAMEGFGRSFEIIAVDDGSRDGSFRVLKSLHERDGRIRVLRFARNFGQNPAVYAGFEAARGAIVVTIDADLQNPPAEIPRLIEKLDEGDYDIVQGWRQARKDSLFRRIASKSVNRVISYLTKAEVNDLGLGMKAYRRAMVDRMLSAQHHSRYVSAESAWHGAKVGEVKVEHRSREQGKTKYNLFSLLRVNFDMIASVSAAPVQIIGMLGVLFALVGFAGALRVVYVRITQGLIDPLTSIVAVFFVLAGVQILCTSILCEYVSRIYIEVQNRPYYIIGERLE